MRESEIYVRHHLVGIVIFGSNILELDYIAKTLYLRSTV